MKSNKFRILMDERERGAIREAFDRLPIQFVRETLPFGDFIISSRCAIERKRGDDFVTSIFDHRLFIQLEKLQQVFTYPLMILENPKMLFTRKFINPKAIFGALVYVSTRMHIPILLTNDENDTASLICDLASHERDLGWHLDGLPSHEDLEKKAPISAADQLYFLQGLVDIGYKRASQLLDVYQTPKLFLYALQNSQVELTKNGTPKTISGLLATFPGFGPKILYRNQKLLTTSYTEAKKQKIRTKIP